MSRVAPWHSSGSPTYHLCTRCADGKGIDRLVRLLGTGGKPLCETCRQLIHTEQC